ncbi:MAG: WYL domain-containing protein [Nocardiopsaceae bacterium]|nr:WYL domain-containing protein [Nocardiopsaceae bacterium]
MRADRLLSLVLLLQARGRMSAHALARELGVSVRTVYRDLAALSSAGVPVITGSGPNGGCRLLDGYRFPLRGLSASEADALLLLGVPDVIAEVGLADALAAAHAKVRAATSRVGGRGETGSGGTGLIHLDMPRWFGAREPVPHLRTLAEALKRRRRLEFGYRRAPLYHGGASRSGASKSGDGLAATRVVGPLGLVNKAGVWYLVASRAAAQPCAALPGARGDPVVFRVGRITAARVLDAPYTPPRGFELAAFWARWSAEFESSLPQVEVRMRASPAALAAFGEIFGDASSGAVASAGVPDDEGFREVTLTFEHEKAAAHRLAGFGGQVEILSPAAVREEIIAAARETLARYEPPAGPLPPSAPPSATQTRTRAVSSRPECAPGT